MMRCISRGSRRLRSVAPAGPRRLAARPAVLAGAMLLTAMPGTLLAAPRCFVVDAARSQVEFRIRVFGLFSPGGRFGGTTGSVVFDAQRWDSLAVSIRIPVDTLESRPRFWRDELLGPRFFDQGHYPVITFDGVRAEQTGPGAGLAFGTLTLRGITRPVTLRARLVPAAEVLEIDAETSVRRSDFGLGGVLPLASEDVSIALHLRAAPGGCGG